MVLELLVPEAVRGGREFDEDDDDDEDGRRSPS